MASMKVIFAVLALAACCQASSVTPVQKVLQMMEGMKTKGEKMMEEEAKTYSDYSKWVHGESMQLGFNIETANSDIEKLMGNIAKLDSDVSKLGSSVKKLQGELGSTEGEKQDATELRDSQNAEYKKISTDYSESVDALQRAIQTMSSKNYDVPEAEALLQKMAVSKPGMQRVLAAFIQAGQKEETSRGGPAVAAYEFQSNSIVQLLESFLKKFKAELDDVETAESNQAHNYANEMIHMSNTIDYMNKEIQEKSVTKAKKASESANAKSDLASTKTDLAEDKKTLSDMEATFAAKSDQFKANQEVRKSELEAIAKAIEIISDPSVSASYSEHVNFAQVKTSLLQVRSARSRVTARQQIAVFLQKKARSLNSEVLRNLAAQVESNPFDKVVGMIKDLVAKLKEEAAAEAEHKQWCDEQLHDNKLKREKKTTGVNKLTATIEALTEDIASMGEKIATLSKEQADLSKAMSEATGQRTKEKTTNTDTMADAQAGEQATKAALVVLKEFYASQGSFLQHKQVPEMAAYKGMSSAKGGVVGMLEVITSDFARLYADTKAAETAAAQEYAQFMSDAKASKKSKHDLEFKTKLKKDQAQFEHGGLVKDLSATQDELDKALAYQQHLKPVCLEVHVSYEERVARRKDEIAALKEAYSVLDQKGPTAIGN